MGSVDIRRDSGPDAMDSGAQCNWPERGDPGTATKRSTIDKAASIALDEFPIAQGQDCRGAVGRQRLVRRIRSVSRKAAEYGYCALGRSLGFGGASRASQAFR